MVSIKKLDFLQKLQFDTSRQANADYTDATSTGGYYSICIDNQFSRFAGKLINLYITVGEFL